MIDREQVDKVVREVLQRYVLEDNTATTRKKIVYDIYEQIPKDEAFQVICDSWNNGKTEFYSGVICCDVYFNDENGGLICMEFQADRSMLTPEDQIKARELAAKPANG